MATPPSPPSPTPTTSAPPPPSRAERDSLERARDEVLAHMLAEERVEAQQVDTALLGRLLRFLRPHRGLAIAALVLGMLDALTSTLPSYVIGLAVDHVAGQDRSGGLDSVLNGAAAGFARLTGSAQADTVALAVTFFALLVFALWTARWVLAIGTSYLMQTLGQRVVHGLRVEVYRHATGMDAQFFQKNPVGRLVNRTTFDVAALAELFGDAFAQGARDLLFVIALAAVMFSLDAPLALILITALPLLVVFALEYRRNGRPAMRTVMAVQSRMTGWLAENLSGMRENQLYRVEPRRRREFERLTDAHQSAMMHAIRAWGWLRPVMLFTTALVTAVVLFVGYERVMAGAITVGVLLTFIQYTSRLWVPVRNLTERFNVIQTSLASGERVMDVLDARATLVDAPDADPALRVRDGHLAFRDVWFHYPGRDPEKTGWVLDGVSFEVPRGGMLALVGDTGAGKSTVAKLVSRFYDAPRGCVEVDGVPVARYALEHLRGAIATVPQDVVVFAGPMRDNLTLGRDIPDDVIWARLEAVCADGLVRRLPGGLDHVLEEGGRTLSTGERQLLSFARAILLDPPILVLDEATANVDTPTELLIQRALQHLTAGRTTLAIAHRLSTIRNADEILVMKRGRIVERGTHQTLLDAGGEYARLYRLHHGQGM
jgi:ATP-binding cassette subfamily B multidrug efflux pump